MQNEFIDSVNQAGEKALNAVNEVAALNASIFKTVLDKQLEIANQFADINAKQARIIAEFKDAPGAFEAQTALIKEITEQSAGNARDAVELLEKTRAAYDRLFEKGLKDATDAVKEAQHRYNAAA